MIGRSTRFFFLLIGALFLTSSWTTADWLTPPAPKAQAVELAGQAPQDSVAVLAWAIEGHFDVEALEAEITDGVHSELEAVLAEIERELGAKPSEILRFFTGSGYLATTGGSEDEGRFGFALEVARPDQLKEWLSGLLDKDEIKRTRHRKFEVWDLEPEGPLWAVSDEWFFLANSMDELDLHINALEGRARLSSDTSYQLAVETLGVKNSGFCLYVDGARASRELDQSLDGSMELPELGFWDYSIVSVDFQARQTDGFLALNQEVDSSIARAMLQEGTIDSEAVRLLPQNMSSMLAMDLRWGLDVWEASGGEAPDLAFLLGMILDEVGQYGDLREAFTGRAVLATNLLDWLGPMMLSEVIGGREDIRECRANLSTLRDHFTSADVDESPEEVWESLSTELPNCPAAGTPTYKYRDLEYGAELYCAGQHHKGLALNNPRIGDSWYGDADLEDSLVGTEYPEVVVMAQIKDARLVHQMVSSMTYVPPVSPLSGCKSNLKNMGTAMEMYSTDWAGEYPENMGLLTPNYLKTIPDCPAAGRNTYSDSLQLGPDADGNTEGYDWYYYFECSGENHRELQANYPRYNGIVGLETGPVKDIPKAVKVRPLTTPDEVQVYGSEESAILLMDPGKNVLTAAMGETGARELALASRKGPLPLEISEALNWGDESLIFLSYNNLQPLFDYGLKASAVLGSEEAERNIKRAMKVLKDLVGDFQDVHAVTVASNGIRYRGKGLSGSPAIGSGTLVGAAIAVPNFIRARSSGQLTACKSNLKNLGTACEMYSTDWSGEYPENVGLLTPNYLRVIPECPAAGADTYTDSYSLNPGPDGAEWKYYECYCKGNHHEGVGIPADYPRYNGMEGLIER
jgi:hypothetical protein